MINFMQERNFSFEQLIRERIPFQRAAVDFEKFESGLSGKFILLPNQLLVNPWDFDFQLHSNSQYYIKEFWGRGKQ